MNSHSNYTNNKNPRYENKDRREYKQRGASAPRSGRNSSESSASRQRTHRTPDSSDLQEENTAFRAQDELSLIHI